MPGQGGGRGYIDKEPRGVRFQNNRGGGRGRDGPMTMAVSQPQQWQPQRQQQSNQQQWQPQSSLQQGPQRADQPQYQRGQQGAQPTTVAPTVANLQLQMQQMTQQHQQQIGRLEWARQEMECKAYAASSVVSSATGPSASQAGAQPTTIRHEQSQPQSYCVQVVESYPTEQRSMAAIRPLGFDQEPVKLAELRHEAATYIPKGDISAQRKQPIPAMQIATRAAKAKMAMEQAQAAAQAAAHANKAPSPVTVYTPIKEDTTEDTTPAIHFYLTAAR